MTYQGECIGGPWDGDEKHWWTRKFVVPTTVTPDYIVVEHPMLPSSASPGMVVIGAYVWAVYHGAGHWFWEPAA